MGESELSIEVADETALNELAFTYEPPEGRVFVEMGRMTSSPMLGFDYLDGVAGKSESS